MLDQKDLELLKTMMETVVNARAEKTETLLLDELARTQSYLEKQIQQVQDNLDELKQYYRITKLENDNTTILLKMVDDLSKRVAELEKKTA